MIFVRLIDENGFFIEDTFVENLTRYTIETPCPGGFHRPKWEGEKWIEGVTQEELDELNSIPVPLSETEQIRLEMARSNAEMFEMMLNMLGGVM